MIMKNVQAISIPQGTVKKIQNVENQIIWGSYQAFPYRKLEYINMEGNYIDTQMKPQVGYYYMDIEYNDLSSPLVSGASYGIFWGNAGYKSSTTQRLFFQSDSTNINYRIKNLADTQMTAISALDSSHRYELLCRTYYTNNTNGRWWIDLEDLTAGTSVYNKYYNSSTYSMDLTYNPYIQINRHLYQSAASTDPTANLVSLCEGNIKFKLFRYFIRADNDASPIVHDMYPAQRKSDNVCGIYDICTGIFYPCIGANATTAAGPTVEEYWNVGADSFSELGYIESTSNAKGAFYIQTDIPMAIKDTMTIDYQLTKATYNQSTGQYYGAMVSSDNLDTRILYVDNSNGTYVCYWNGSSYKVNWGANKFNTNRHSVQIGFADSNNRVLARIDTTTGGSTISSTNAAAINKLSFFGQKYDGSQYSLIAKLYGVTIRNSSNVLIHDLVPALNTHSGIAGLYDKVTGKFYGNSGTGTFTYDYKYPYRQLEYIHFNGAEYIATTFGDNAGKIGFSLDNTNSGQCIAGAFNTNPPTGNSGRYELGTINSSNLDVYYNVNITSPVSVSTYLPANTYREIRHEVKGTS